MIGTQAHVEPFETYVESRRVEIDSALDQVLPCPPLCPVMVADAMRYGVTGRAKRLRPLLTLAAAETVAAANYGDSVAVRTEARRLAMPAACAIELIHSYSLIHDDLPAMDNDSMRRGRPTVHIVYGEAMAILAGDGLLAEAFSLLANAPIDCGFPHLAERKLRVLKRVGGALGAGGMLGGQAMDLESARQPVGIDPVALREMHARKTGSLVRAAGVAGAIMVGGDSPQIAAIDRFAAELGLAFQIIDDILDEESPSDILGKTAGKDRAQGKLTYPMVLGLERSRALATACVERAHDALQAANLAPGRLMPLAFRMIGRTC